MDRESIATDLPEDELQGAETALETKLIEDSEEATAEQEFEPIGSTDEPEDETVVSRWAHAKEWANNNKIKLALGASAVSLAATATFNPLGEVTDELIEASPWVAAGLVASEGMFVGGLAMMATSVGSSVRNPLKIRDKLPEICRQANDSMLFRSGFWVNTVGAVGTAAVIGGGIVAKMPPESYGLLSFSAIDLTVTVAVRKALLTGIRNKSTELPQN